MKAELSLLGLITLLASCDEHFEPKELYGLYAPRGYVNTYDTIELKPGSLYHRRVYNKNRKIVLDMGGTWTLERNCIVHFVPFYLNLDDDLVRFPESVKDTSGGWQGYTETRGGIIRFCVGYYAKMDTNCYYKLK